MASRPITAESVVPISSIFDALEGVLTEAERQALLSQLTDLRADGVAPGDLITAGMFNEILSDINDLKIRMAGLEAGSGAPVIIRTVPSGDLVANSVVNVIGSNFNREPRRNIVLLGDQLLTPLRTGSETSISFVVPFDLPNLPTQMRLSVENEGLSSNSLLVTVVEPAFAQSGDFDVGPVVAPQGTMIAGQALELTWPVTADTSLADELNFTLQVDNATGATAQRWRNNVTFSPTPPAAIAVGQTVPVTATINVPSGATAADLALVVTGREGMAAGNSQPPLEWRAGSPLEVSDPLADLRIDGVVGPFTEVENMIVSGTTFHGVRLAPGATGRIQFELQYGDDGSDDVTFALQAAVESNASNWQVSEPVPQQLGPMPPGADLGFNVDITNSGGASGQVTFLRVEAVQTGSSPPNEIRSFAIVPLELT